MIYMICKFIFDEIRYKIFNQVNSVEKARKLGVKIGDKCRIINVTFSSEPYLVTIGNHVSATNVHFETHDGGVWVFRNDHPEWDIIAPITIGDNVFFGKDVIILPGVNIGSNIVVGAGSIVTKNLESGWVYAGVPAKKIKPITQYYDDVKIKKIDTKHMDYDEKKFFLEKKYKQ
jgi:acetyltransferase-like isoleucine patch superfamily enzyme